MIEGTWPARCEQRAFVLGAKWAHFRWTGATMWSADRQAAEEEAVTRFGAPIYPTPDALEVAYCEGEARERDSWLTMSEVMARQMRKALDEAAQEAATDERETIVEWLRQQHDMELGACADAIEKEWHRA